MKFYLVDLKIFIDKMNNLLCDINYEQKHTLSKRNILSVIHKLFNPIGLVHKPCHKYSKIFLSRMLEKKNYLG